MDEQVDKCCPSSYTCRSEEAMGVPLTSCFYGNVTYEVGQDVPVKGPCRRGCQCRASLDKQHPAKIECAIVECPSKFSPLKPGCRSKFSVEECCEVEQECNDLVSNDEVVTNENVTLRSADCFSEGFEYYLGDKIFFGKAPCQYCVCSEEFTGSSGPSCTKMDCAMEYRDREYLVSGCIPLYRDGTCCPTDWICPDSPQIISDPDMVAKGDETASTHCTIGKTVAPRGTALKTYDCHVNCACSTPPDFTCVQYATCEIALSALKAGTTL
uniref:Kielin/chordin-like protein n=1 Tax=Hirondellea gigas TaxID=1518452 RepID=A0A6A7FMY8_9CRUS